MNESKTYVINYFVHTVWYKQTDQTDTRQIKQIQDNGNRISRNKWSLIRISTNRYTLMLFMFVRKLTNCVPFNRSVFIDLSCFCSLLLITNYHSKSRAGNCLKWQINASSCRMHRNYKVKSLLSKNKWQ